MLSNYDSFKANRLGGFLKFVLKQNCCLMLLSCESSKFILIYNSFLKSFNVEKCFSQSCHTYLIVKNFPVFHHPYAS